MATKYIIARQLGGKVVITASGERIGRLDDVMVNEITGNLVSLIVEPEQSAKAKMPYPKDDRGYCQIPYDRVNAVGEMVVIRDVD
jgi:sporulation protein YlmC with PRC-barrel domain